VIYLLGRYDDAGGGLDAPTIVVVTPAPRPHPTPRWSSTLVWGLLALAVLGLAVIVWFDHLLRQAGRPDLSPLGSDDYGYVLTVASAVAVGALLALRRPRHPVGWLLLALGLSVLTAGVTTGYAGYGLLVRAESLWAADYAAWWNDAGFVVWQPCSGSSWCSLRPDRCPRRAGAGGPGWQRPRRSSGWSLLRCKRGR
jgi:hypothetical protein